MKHTPKGTSLSKAEIVALLGFAHDDPERIQFYGVDFKLTHSGIRARATNGHIAIDGVGPNTTERRGQWFVHRDFLKRSLKVLDNTDVLVLKFSGASLRDADVFDKDGVQRSTFSWPEDAANAQTSFPDEHNWDEILRPPPVGRDIRYITVNAEYLALLAKMAAAAETAGVDCYPPAKAESPCYYRAEGIETETTWEAAIMPIRGDEEKQSIGKNLKEELRKAVDGFQDVADSTGTTVSMVVDGEETVLAKPKKGRKSK